MAGGSVANTIRGLASGFGVTCGIIGACGDDDQGSLFFNTMNSHKVNLSRLRLKNGHTAQKLLGAHQRWMDMDICGDNSNSDGSLYVDPLVKAAEMKVLRSLEKPANKPTD